MSNFEREPFFPQKIHIALLITLTKNYIITFLVLFNKKKHPFSPKNFKTFLSYNIRNGTYKTWSLYKIFKKQSKNKERIDNIREELKNPLYNISKKESKDIKSTLYTIEKTGKIITKKTSKYLDKLDKRIQELDKYKDYDNYKYKGIKNIAIGKPILIKSSLDKPITLYEYFNLVEERLIDLMKEHQDEEEIKVQLTTETNLV